MIEKPGFNEGPHAPEIETIRKPDGDEFSCSPERGGIITSLKFQDIEILYLDQETFKDPNSNVKGGIPILFPNAGPIDSSQFPNLKQHGFARNLKWIGGKIGTSAFYEFVISDGNITMYPFKFKLTVGGMFKRDGSFSISQKVKNEGTKDMPISMGLHPYFRVPGNKKEDIRFNFKGGEEIEKNVAKWANGEAFSVANPKVDDPNAVMEVYIPSLGTLTIDASDNYRRIWIWSQRDKPFVCIEPVMRDSGGLVNDPATVLPGKEFRAYVNIKFKRKI